MKKEPTKKNPYPYCLHGCGVENKPGSRFKQGHDAKLLSRLRKVERGNLGANSIPGVLIEAAKRNPELKVAGYTAADILRLAGCGGDGEDWAMKRGEIWRVSPSELSGSGAGYAGIVLIIQDNRFNASRISTAIVAAVTEDPSLEETEGNVFLGIGGAGLSKNSFVNFSQISTVDKGLFTERVGVLTPEIMGAVDGGLRLALGL